MHVFFDLDGTLTDSRMGIARCYRHALVELGATCPEEEALTDYVGPPLATAFSALLGTSDAVQIDRAITAFRRRFEPVGMFENALYPGIAVAIAELAAIGFRLSVVTAKPHVYATRILEHFGLGDRFTRAYGPELADRTYSKEALIRHACAVEQVNPHRCLMVGDRVEDILGAKANGLRAVGVLWGYGSEAELRSAQPEYLVASSVELVACLRPQAEGATLPHQKRDRVEHDGEPASGHMNR
jgi:phosphoglycolate phosphatase